MKFTVDIPFWAREEEDEDWILFLAFIQKLMTAYGTKYMYELYNHDLRHILGIYDVQIPTLLEEKPWSNRLKCINIKSDSVGIQYVTKKIRRKTQTERVPRYQSVQKELTDSRCIMVWIYLMGAFNNNLVEKPQHKERLGLSRDWRDILKAYGKIL